jgi:hypothetical protein
LGDFLFRRGHRLSQGAGAEDFFKAADHGNLSNGAHCVGRVERDSGSTFSLWSPSLANLSEFHPYDFLPFQPRMFVTLLAQRKVTKRKGTLPLGPADCLALLEAAGILRTRFAQTAQNPFRQLLRCSASGNG